METGEISEKETQIDEYTKKVLSKIKNAWIAGVMSIVITTVMIFVSLSGNQILSLDVFSFVDVVLMIGLVFGIYKKSRICAVLMFLYFLANKIIYWSEYGMQSGVALALVFLWFYFQGVVGTFQYHKRICGVRS